jgi:hypothetical protein
MVCYYKRVLALVINLTVGQISQDLEKDNPTKLISALSSWQLGLTQNC